MILKAKKKVFNHNNETLKKEIQLYKMKKIIASLISK